jgi:hypothetical protein
MNEWKHEEEIAGEKLADEVIFLNSRQLIGELFRYGFVSRIIERLTDDNSQL